MIGVIIIVVFMILVCLAIMFGLMLLVKNEVTCRNRILIIDAVYAYHADCIKDRKFVFGVDYRDMESYDSTFYRLWDWGYENILPREKFEIIKPYIKPKKEKTDD